MCNEIFTHVVSDHMSSEEKHDFSNKDDDTDTIVTHILYHLKDNSKNIIGILTCESGELFLRYFKQYLNGVFTEYFGEQIGQSKEMPSDLLLTHISSSFVEMVNWWIQNNMKQTPEQMESYFAAVILPILA